MKATQVRLSHELAPTPVPVLDAEQARVLESHSDPILVVGGPGTGKTTTLIAASAARAQAGDVSRVLFLTLGRSAVAHARLALAARLPDSSLPEVRTWHGLAYAIVDAERQQRVTESASLEQSAAVGPLQLLTGAEYEMRIRELILGALEDRRSPWPRSLAEAQVTRGFARDVRALLVTLRTLGIDPPVLSGWARTATDESLREVLQGAATFASEAFDVLDFEGVSDHSDVLHRAGLAIDATGVSPYDAIFVDQAHDLDAAMVRLLAALVRGGAEVVLAADPDQSVETFRGADQRLMGELESQVFHRSVTVQQLTHDYAHPSELRRIIEHVSARIPAAPLSASAINAIRHATPNGAAASVIVATFDSASAQAAHIADLLLRRQGQGQRPASWSDFAVVVHGPAAFAPLARAFDAAGIPFEVPRDEVPLRDHPAVRSILVALELAADLAAGSRPSSDSLRSFLLGPLVRLDAAALRRLSRALRASAREAGNPTITADQALFQAVLDQRLLLELRDDDDVDALRAGAQLLAHAQAALTSRKPVSDVLWSIWNAAAHYGNRLRTQALAGGPDGRRADRDLDAILVLFDAAERADARYQQRRSVRTFLDELRGQDFGAESLVERGAPRPAVTILTARRARGRFWPVVVVAGVNEGEWPMVQATHNVVAADRISALGITTPPTRADLLAEERRVFHLAVSRATSELVVTAVASPSDDGLQPSRFFTEVVHSQGQRVEDIHARGYPWRSLNPEGVVASLRRLATSDASGPEVLTAAALRLASLAVAVDDSGLPLFEGAAPTRWWGVREPTQHTEPIYPPHRPLEVSATTIQGVDDCMLRYFFERRAGAKSADTQAAAFGTVLHSVAEALVEKTVEPTMEAIGEVIDDVWPYVASEAQWAAEQERAEALAMAQRLLDWHLADRGRSAEDGERKFTVPLEVPRPDGGTEQVELKGSIDRVEVDTADPTGVHIVDFKTSKQPPVRKTLDEHPQLGIYRLIVELGGLDELVPNAHVAGAELVELRQVDKFGAAKIYAVSGPTDGSWPERIGTTAAALRDEVLNATPSDSVCRTCPLTRLCPAQPAGRRVIE